MLLHACAVTANTSMELRAEMPQDEFGGSGRGEKQVPKTGEALCTHSRQTKKGVRTRTQDQCTACHGAAHRANLCVNLSVCTGFRKKARSFYNSSARDVWSCAETSPPCKLAETFPKSIREYTVKPECDDCSLHVCGESIMNFLKEPSM